MNFLVNLLFGRLAKSLDGYKTTIGSVGLILLGIVGIIGHYWPDSQLPPMEIDKAMGMVAAGLTALGVGGKLQKVINK